MAQIRGKRTVGSTGSINSKEHVLLVGERDCLNDWGVFGVSFLLMLCKGREEVISLSYNLRYVLIHVTSHSYTNREIASGVGIECLPWLCGSASLRSSYSWSESIALFTPLPLFFTLVRRRCRAM